MEDYADREEIYSNAVRAGKRTYFFDVRKTRGEEHYLTMTESKRKYNDDGTFHYQKHKIFLYKEDFEKFTGALSDAIQKIVELNNASGHTMAENISDNLSGIDYNKEA